MNASTRRAALGAILAAPLASVPACAARTSDLARSCEWAADHWLGLDARCHAEKWDDDKLDAEADLYNAVFRRALAEPSGSLADLKAKARLCLVDVEAQLFPMRNMAENDEPDEGERMVLTVLQEVIALCA
ncbi:hypothetical protein [Methylobacterium sp. GC_Met_2]|uniref:hypothetical protein n=1 Tax=Methylobacterium sp. GC_Met_2 TaxID=2937376 RepID=UPI00226B1D89|nr:hypothetical protein [Methylobacterium sp. GC_Met_2]